MKPEKPKFKKDILVFYHANCADGFSAAWAAWKKFGHAADYIPLSHGSTMPDLKEKNIFFIDIVPPEAAIKKIIANNKEVIAIDHHTSNQELMPLFEKSVYDSSKSASVLAWEYFHPDESLPALLRYVQDMDLWQWRLLQSRDICTYINFVDMSFETWDRMAADLEYDAARDQIVDYGSHINRYKDKKIREIVERNAQKVIFDGVKALAVNSSTLTSQIGDALLKRNVPLGIVWVEANDKIHVSMRSDGSVDVAELAKKYGGGGHIQASGFRLPLGTALPWEVIET